MRALEQALLGLVAVLGLHLEPHRLHRWLLMGVTTTHGTWLVLMLVGVHIPAIEVAAVAFVASESASNLFGGHH